MLFMDLLSKDRMAVMFDPLSSKKDFKKMVGVG